MLNQKRNSLKEDKVIMNPVECCQVNIILKLKDNLEEFMVKIIVYSIFPKESYLSHLDYLSKRVLIKRKVILDF